MADDISITNGALYRIGEKPISSLDQGTRISDLCKELYPGIRDDCLTKATWPFAIMRQALSRLVATPPSDFQYYYALPTEPFCLQIIEPQIELLGELFRREIYLNPGDPNDQHAALATDATTVILTYIGRVSEGLWHPAFVRYMTLALAGDLAQVITGKATVTAGIMQERDRALLQAKNQIAQEGTPRQAPLPMGYIEVRGTGGAQASTQTGG